MAGILRVNASAGTHTIPRCWDNTETPKQVVRTKEMDWWKLSARSVRASQVGVLTFVSGAKEFSTAPSGLEAFLVSSPQDQTDAIFEAPGADLSARLGQVLPVIGPLARDEDFVFAKVVERLLSRSIPMTHQRVTSSTSTQARRRYDSFRSKLIAELLDEPIEDGVTHPAEHVINEALRTNSLECQDWLSRALVEHYQTRPSISASIVRCVGRVEYDRVGHWGMRVADDALRHRDVEVREAAVRALEAWGGREALSMLRRHRDSVAWLHEYVSQVIVDLSGTKP